MTHFILATAGHVDHGKSALVKRLTGTDPDRLPEEKRRGVTIDLGFAELPLTAKDGRQFLVGIVDVPGHEDFVRNMIAGVGSIDIGLLVVAADDGWMPQTEEHFAILNYLEVPRLVVAITKCDVADGQSAGAEVRNELKGSLFADAPIVETSVTLGRGLSDLKTALAETLAAAPPPLDYEKPRLPIDRVFTLRGIGTVITGTLTGGKLTQGETIWLQPTGIETRIRSIQSHNRSVTVAQPGMRTALSLPEIEAGNSAHAAKRGDMIGGNSSTSTQTIDVLLQISGRRVPGIPAIKTNMKVDLHHGSARIRALVSLLERTSLGRGESGLARVVLERPALAFYRDRFVVRDTAQKHTLAGGIVLDPDVTRGRHRKDRQLVFLHARAEDSDSIAVAILTQIQRDHFVTTADLLQKSPFTTEQISNALRQLASDQKISLAGGLAADIAAWRTLRNRAAELIDEAHAKNPQDPGLNLSILRSGLTTEMRTRPSQDVGEIVNALVADLASTDFLQKGQTIARPSHRPTLPAALQGTADDILRRLSEKAFDPPALKAAASDPNARKAIKFLIESGKVIEINSDVHLSIAAYKDMKDIIIAFLREKPAGASASELRVKLQTSRRTLIPLLEYLDREKVTRRQGDLRTLA